MSVDQDYHIPPVLIFPQPRQLTLQLSMWMFNHPVYSSSLPPSPRNLSPPCITPVERFVTIENPRGDYPGGFTTFTISIHNNVLNYLSFKCRSSSNCVTNKTVVGSFRLGGLSMGVGVGLSMMFRYLNIFPPFLFGACINYSDLFCSPVQSFVTNKNLTRQEYLLQF